MTLFRFLKVGDPFTGHGGESGHVLSIDGMRVVVRLDDGRDIVLDATLYTVGQRVPWPQPEIVLNGTVMAIELGRADVRWDDGSRAWYDNEWLAAPLPSQADSDDEEAGEGTEGAAEGEGPDGSEEAAPPPLPLAGTSEQAKKPRRGFFRRR